MGDATDQRHRSVIDRFEDEYRFLSNFYPATLVYDGEQWATSEHAFQAAKTPEAEWKRLIREAETPGVAKRLGRQAPVYAGWDFFRDRVMLDILHEKFTHNFKLEELLIGTGDAELIEGNTWGDIYWGVCDGVGENRLGKLLMEVREYRKTYRAAQSVAVVFWNDPCPDLERMLTHHFDGYTVRWRLQDYKDGRGGGWWATLYMGEANQSTLRDKIEIKGREVYDAVLMAWAEVVRRTDGRFNAEPV